MVVQRESSNILPSPSEILLEFKRNMPECSKTLQSVKNKRAALSYGLRKTKLNAENYLQLVIDNLELAASEKAHSSVSRHEDRSTSKLGYDTNEIPVPSDDSIVLSDRYTFRSRAPLKSPSRLHRLKDSMQNACQTIQLIEKQLHSNPSPNKPSNVNHAMASIPTSLHTFVHSESIVVNDVDFGVIPPPAAMPEYSQPTSSPMASIPAAIMTKSIVGNSAFKSSTRVCRFPVHCGGKLNLEYGGFFKLRPSCQPKEKMDSQTNTAQESAENPKDSALDREMNLLEQFNVMKNEFVALQSEFGQFLEQRHKDSRLESTK
jgi:hypothetical protein